LKPACPEEARRTLIQYHGGDAVVIPNGVNVGPFADAPKDDPRFRGTDEAPTISFLGRLDEPRKGLRVLADAIPTVLESVPGARFLVAGRGQAQEIREELARFFLEAGIPVYLEKPLAITIEAADRILEVARRTGTRLYVGHNMRHMEVVRLLKSIIDSGRIGEGKALPGVEALLDA